MSGSMYRDSIMENINASLEGREPNYPDRTHELQTMRFRGDPEDAYREFDEWVQECNELYPNTFRIHNMLSNQMPSGMFLIVTFNV